MNDSAWLLRPGESFLGLSYEQLAAAGTGRIIPDGKGGGRIEAANAEHAAKATPSPDP